MLRIRLYILSAVVMMGRNEIEFDNERYVLTPLVNSVRVHDSEESMWEDI